MAPLCEEKDGEIQCHVSPRYIWLMMVRPVVVLLLLLLAINYVYGYPDVQQSLPWPFNTGALVSSILIAAIILVPSFVWIWLMHKNFIYIIKTDELVIRKGVLRKRHSAIPYNKIRNVQRMQSVLEMLFGLCTIRIETSGISLAFPDSIIPGMLNAKELPEMILKKTHANQQADTDLHDTMRQILTQLKDLNERSQRQEDHARLEKQ